MKVHGCKLDLTGGVSEPLDPEMLLCSSAKHAKKGNSKQGIRVGRTNSKLGGRQSTQAMLGGNLLGYAQGFWNRGCFSKNVTVDRF